MPRILEIQYETTYALFVISHYYMTPSLGKDGRNI